MPVQSKRLMLVVAALLLIALSPFIMLNGLLHSALDTQPPSLQGLLGLLFGTALLSWGNALGKYSKYPCSIKTMGLEGLLWFLEVLVIITLLLLVMLRGLDTLVMLVLVGGLLAAAYHYVKPQVSERRELPSNWFI